MSDTDLVELIVVEAGEPLQEWQVNHRMKKRGRQLNYSRIMLGRACRRGRIVKVKDGQQVFYMAKKEVTDWMIPDVK